MPGMAGRNARASLGALALLALSAASACPAEPAPTYGAVPEGPSVLLSSAGRTSAYRGVGRLDVGSMVCTAVFTVPPGAVPDDAPAYALTAGHCVEIWEPDEVVRDRPAPAYEITFDYFSDDAERSTFRARAVAYGTMKGRDIAVVELDATVGALRRAGIAPWQLATEAGAPDEPLVVVHALLGSFLRLSACAARGVAEVVREHHWRWFGLQRNACADIGPGSSGAPAIARSSGRLLAILGTSTRGSEGIEDCALDRPCEPQGEGATVLPDVNYAVPVSGLVMCFDPAARFNPALRGCPLDLGTQGSPGRARARRAR